MRLRKQLVFARMKLDKHFGVAFSNTIRDNPLDNRIPTEEELEVCLQHLYEDIEELQGLGLSVVVPLGNAARRALIPESKGSMAADHGTVHWIFNDIFEKILMVPTYHPSSLLFSGIQWNPKDPDEKDMVVIDDIIKALTIADEFKVPIEVSEQLNKEIYGEVF